MRNIARFALFFVLVAIGCFACLAQSDSVATVKQQQGEQAANAADAGVTPLTYPYSISTEPHFAVFVEFPKADSIRRIALGDSNYFLAEADKTDPHYAIIKQIEAPAPKAKLPVETNMLVYMASGQVVDITLRAGKLEGTAYSIDYVVPRAETKDPQPKKDDPPSISPEELEKKLRDKERSDLVENMMDRVNVRFTSVVLTNDREMPISGLALMKDGSAGLVGKLKGKGNPVLAGAARVGTGAAVVATEFAGQGSVDQPFSQGDYLRNQMAAEVGSQGNQLSNRLQQPISIPIVAVDANQPIRIFLLDPLTISGKTTRNPTPGSQLPSEHAAEQSATSDQSMATAQSAYIEALEAQLAEMKAGAGKSSNDHQ